MVVILPQRKEFLSTPSARRATIRYCRNSRCTPYFYPRPPRGGRPVFVSTDGTAHPDFYPRPPRGGRPIHADHVLNQMQDFYPRPPRGGRLRRDADRDGQQVISIHALREEGDPIIMFSFRGVVEFLSTPSARRATTDTGLNLTHDVISIHALREEGDIGDTVHPTDAGAFLSTPSARRATA